MSQALLRDLVRWMQQQPDVTDKGWLRKLRYLGLRENEGKHLLTVARLQEFVEDESSRTT